MKYFADFHIHSKFSRATSKNLDLENLYIAAQIKGITVLGTGDFTHPGWWQEIQQKLEPAEEGLLKLKPEIARACDRRVPTVCRQPVRFMLVTAISNIYKKGEHTRKNHNLVFMPHAEAAQQFNRRLDAIGNICSDGRPILGLDARNLLEIVLETAPGGFLIPAHIWTPWFSLLGSKSGFDSVEECFDDLSTHIFALETGLSSDPPMNWRVSHLDRFTLVSNSDAHSAAKLGREANQFNTDLSYPAIRQAIETGDGQCFQGTIEFYPEEGKYHVDGHRKCGFRCQPDETRRRDNRCPHCGKPLTLGVLYRVEALADREQGIRPAGAADYHNLIPLDDLLAEVLQQGPKTKKVTQAYEQLIAQYGPELEILCHTPRASLEKSNVPLLAEAICRMRDGKVFFDPGYDGEFGKVRLFDPQERNQLQGQQRLFDIPETSLPQSRMNSSSPPRLETTPQPSAPKLFDSPQPAGFRLNPRQQAVVDYGKGPLLICAGPGTGKTRAITCRMAVLIEERDVPADKMLAVTFTNKAAREMHQRLQKMLDPGAVLPMVTTFHGFCWRLLKEVYSNQAGAILDDAVRKAVLTDVMAMESDGIRTADLSADALLDLITVAKQQLLRPTHDLRDVAPRIHLAPFTRIYANYQRLLTFQDLYDFDDLILEAVDQLETDSAWRNEIRNRFTHIFVDEFQDINYGQYRLLRAIAPANANLCVIGDPDQAIYGFRGSDLRYFRHFARDFPKCGRIHLARNYRSTQTILSASHQVIQKGRRAQPEAGPTERIYSNIEGFKTISVVETTSARAEAVTIGQTIEQMVGGTGFHSVDFNKLGDWDHQREHSFADFAVLCRTGRQVEQIAQQLTRATIPCQWVSRRALRKPGLHKLLATFRVMNRQGSYADFGQLNGLSAYGISKATMDLFKQWAYSRQLPLATALHSANRVPITGMSHRRQQRLVALVGLLNQLQDETIELNVEDTLTHIVSHTTLASRIETADLNRLRELAAAFKNDKTAFGSNMALQRDTDLYQPGIEKVAVMTLHAAKGLEFPVVFIAGCEENLLPLRRQDKAVDLEEERRLFYVGMTRAQSRLYLTYARRRTHDGETRNCQLSRFVTDIEPDLKANEIAQAKSKKATQQQLSLF